MQKGYLFIYNSRELTQEQLDSKEPFKTGSFEAPSIYAANEKGWKLYQGINRTYPNEVRALDYDITFYNQNVFRNIFDWNANKVAYNNLCAFLKEHPDIDIIHCNTPIGGVLGRLCGKKFNKKVVYTAHGFHFYKGAPLINRTIFKWVEKFLAHYTDVLITINHEDYEAAQSFKLKKGGRVEYVPGVGIDLNLYKQPSTESRKQKRTELGLKEGDVALISMGDLVLRKNYAMALEVIAAAKNPKLQYFVCGDGPEQENLQSMSERLGIANQVHLLGRRNDVKDMLYASDIFVFTTLQEGLPRSAMEAMATGLPCLMSAVRGNTDLMESGTGGYLCELSDITDWVEKLNALSDDVALRTKMGEYNLQRILDFDVRKIQERMLEVFKEL